MGRKNKGKDCRGVQLNAPTLQDTVFCFMDVETTGLHPHYGDRICEIALLTTKNNRILASYSSLINPHRPISPGAYRVNRITTSMVKNAPSFVDVVDSVLAFIQGTVLVAHNAAFDLNFFGAQLTSLKIPFPKNTVLDTLTLARAYYRFPSNALTSLAYYLKIETKGVHRALEDARITKDIFHTFLDDFRRERQITTIYELLELHGGSITFPTYGEIILPPEIEECLKSRRRLKIGYLSRDGARTSRTIKPLDIMAYQDYTYLIAHCFLREERRTFRLDRILELKVVD